MRKLALLLLYVCFIAVGKLSAQNWAQQKFGIFIHYGWGQTPDDEYGFPITQNPDGTYPQSVDEVADNFDLDAFAASMAQIKPEYVIFTAWHGGMFPLFPSEKMDEWVGEGHCSKRDLIGELLDAMIALDIDVILYTQPDEAKNFDPEDQVAVNYTGKNNETFNDFVNDVYAEMIDRYGTKISGMWFDSGSRKASIDKARLRETVLSRLPDAALISINSANNVTDYGCAEIRKPYMFGTKEGFENIDPSDEETWPGLDKSVAFVNDQYWWSVPGSYGLDELMMYKYNILQAATCTEGGGVSWAIGPFPGDDMWNDKVMPSMTSLAARIDSISESIKNTLTSSSYPLEHGTRINELEWGVATQSTDSIYEYIHVLHTPSGDTLTIPLPADDKIFYSGINLRSGNAVSITYVDTVIKIVLDPNDSWHSIHSVLKLSTVKPDEEIDLCSAPIDGFLTIQAEAFCEMSGIQLETGTDSDGTDHVAYIENGDYIRFGAVDFGSAIANSVTVRVASKNTGGTIEIRSGSATGDIVGSITVDPTGAWETWASVSIPIDPLTGSNDLYFVFTGGTRYLFNINWIEFSGESPATTQTIELKEGWNLVSLYIQPEPCREAQPCVSTVFPNAAMVKTFDTFYSSTQLEFLNSLTAIEAGAGYLVYNSIDEIITITGVETHGRASLQEGWNLIGVSSSVAIPVSDYPEALIIKNFDAFYESGNTLNSLTELEPGKAYFVKK